MHDYLAEVRDETYRVLVDGCIACINIGDATRNIKGKFQLYPNHSRITEICEKSASQLCRSSYGKNLLPNQCTRVKVPFWAQVSFRQMFTLRLTANLFCYLGRENSLNSLQKILLLYESVFTKKERDKRFSQIWSFKGTRQTVNDLERRTAAYPVEIAHRLIRMFSVKGDLFLGSGTIIKIAFQNERNIIGYETDSIL